MHLHLRVFQPAFDLDDPNCLYDEDSPYDKDPSQVSMWNPIRYDFYWNHDYTAFRPVLVRWWDDESYIAYQCGDNEQE